MADPKPGGLLGGPDLPPAREGRPRCPTCGSQDIAARMRPRGLLVPAVLIGGGYLLGRVGGFETPMGVLAALAAGAGVYAALIALIALAIDKNVCRWCGVRWR